MTTPDTFAKTPRPPGRFQLPDPPEREPDDMTSFNQLTITGGAHYLAQHLGNPETTLVVGEHYISPVPTGDMAGLRYPDLFVAFGVDPAAYGASNGYVISEQGKPPDFVLEIASRRTGRIDVTEKRDDYAALGIGEYWRFDETGQYHGTRLAGERLVDGVYQPITIGELAGGSLRGYSAALDLHLRWERGELVFYDPGTGRSIATLADERARTNAEREARMAAETRADTAEAQRNAEREALDAAEARVRELEELLRRQNP